MMEDQIITLLKNSELHSQISQVMTEVYKWAGTYYDDPPKHLKTFADEELFNEAWEDAMLSVQGEGDLNDLLKKHVFAKIPVPHRIQFNEVLEMLFDMAKPDARSSLCGDREYADSAYTSFLNYLNDRVLLHRDSAPFPVCAILGGETVFVGTSWSHQTVIVPRGDHDSVSNGNGPPGIYEGTLWSSDAGVSLCLVGKGDFKSRFRCSFHVMAQITGRTSEAAWKELSEEFERILPSMWRSVKMLGKTWQMCERNPTIVDWDFANIDEFKLPVISEADFEKRRAFVKECIDAYFYTPTKKRKKEEDTMDRRIRNAVHLLIASDAQSSNAVGLALSVAAIEALLGQEGAELSYRLADNIAALLEPEVLRRQKAFEFIRGLYGKRSRVLHGDDIEDDGDVRLQGRQLAAAVLHGVLTCRDYRKRCGDAPKTPTDFLKDLHERRFEPGQPWGLLESNVRELWR